MVGAAAVVTAIAIGEATPAAADVRHRALASVLTGAVEVPGPGDDDGIGLAGVLVNVNRGRICYALGVKHIGTVTAAHIHVGVAGEAGVIVVPLDAPVTGFSANCANVDRMLASDIANEPERFYVNVHTSDFPMGAIRGPLG